MIIILIILSIIIIFFAPYGYHIDLGPGPNMLMAITWDISDYYGFHILESLEYFPYYLFRIVFLYEVYRFLKEKISRKRFFIIGLISELIPLLFSIPGMLILNSDGENYIPIMISIPVLLLIDLFVIYIYSINLREEIIGN